MTTNSLCYSTPTTNSHLTHSISTPTPKHSYKPHSSPYPPSAYNPPSPNPQYPLSPTIKSASFLPTTSLSSKKLTVKKPCSIIRITNLTILLRRQPTVEPFVNTQTHGASLLVDGGRQRGGDAGWAGDGEGDGVAWAAEGFVREEGYGGGDAFLESGGCGGEGREDEGENGGGLHFGGLDRFDGRSGGYGKMMLKVLVGGR